ncbi:F/Y rich C-terminus-domain-containing protein [Mycena belliarum]|uniref:F/Y rich C-terminus-domain-containing protein n=1 Tax=Mycena belliarum TaxID=1033014 RepID=A0AAD6XJU7_9AGAR|nr:F/Y rich C-terminus-domain-containing protein [Mycena belliae]
MDPAASSSLSPSSKAKEAEIHEKYRSLKRRFFELEEKHKETSTELLRSGERNAKMREERNILLDRIIELEAQPGFVMPAGSPTETSPSGAFPRSLLDAHARTSFTDNLRAAAAEDDADADAEIDPTLSSRHVQNDDATIRRSPRRTRGNKNKDADGEGDPSTQSPPKATRRSSRRSAAATAPSVSRTRVIQAPKSAGTRAKPAAAAPPADSGGGESAPPKAESPALDSGAGINGHVPPASPMTRPANLAFNPYYPYLAPSPSTAPNPYVNPYAYYMPPPMPAAYMPPPQFAPPRPPAEAPRAAKPKRLKAHTVTSKSYSIPMVPRDKSGKPMLPLNVGIMTVISLGAVCMREHFHTERYIFPVGYEVTRRYLSTVDVAAEVVYHCTILDGGDGPKFQIIPSDVPDRPIIAGTATGAWSAIVKQANAIRQRAHSNSVSGPDFFGLGQNTIKHLIQELPNADRLRDYVWQQFVEGGPLGGRHAAVIPALPEEYEGGRLVGAYYPPRETQEGEKRGNYYPPHILAQAASAPPPQKRPEYRDGSRVVMPPGGGPIAGGSGGGGNYYLPHTQQQGRASPPEPLGYPGPPNGSPYPPGANNNGNGSFASIMNAFPTQQNGNGGEGGGGP